MEGKRIFDFTSFEFPYGCYQSAQTIIGEIEAERAKLPKDEFRKLLLVLIKVCNRFKGSLEMMNLSENKRWDGQLEEAERDQFREALIIFRYNISVQVAAMAEHWRVEIPQALIPEDMMHSLFPQLKTRD